MFRIEFAAAVFAKCGHDRGGGRSRGHGVSRPAAAGLGGRGRARSQPGPVAARDRADRAAARRHAARKTTRNGRGADSHRPELSRGPGGALLAGVRNMQPRRKSASSSTRCWWSTRRIWLASASPDEHRWLPIFWAIDYFKEAQAQDRKGRRLAMHPWTSRPCRPPARHAPHSSRRWTAGTSRRPTRPWRDWHAPRA